MQRKFRFNPSCCQEGDPFLSRFGKSQERQMTLAWEAHARTVFSSWKKRMQKRKEASFLRERGLKKARAIQLSQVLGCVPLLVYSYFC